MISSSNYIIKTQHEDTSENSLRDCNFDCLVNLGREKGHMFQDGEKR